jgi:hypothetical protein
LKGNEEKPVIGFSWRSKKPCRESGQLLFIGARNCSLAGIKRRNFRESPVRCSGKGNQLLKERAGDRFIDLKTSICSTICWGQQH